MMTLGRGGSASGEHPRNHHQPRRSSLGGMRCMGRGSGGVLGTGADNHGDPGVGQPPHPFLPLGISQQRPVAHRPAVDHRRHTRIDQLPGGCHEDVVQQFPAGIAGGHQGGHAALEDIHQVLF